MTRVWSCEERALILDLDHDLDHTFDPLLSPFTV